jgi:DME family drug/metabolite transporter
VTIAAIAWGTGGVVASILYRTSGLGAIAVSFWRTLGGVILLGAVYAWRQRNRPSSSSSTGDGGGDRADRAVVAGRRWPRSDRGRRWLVNLVTGAGLAIYQTAYYAAVHASGVAFATVVTLGAGPILIALAARFAIGERLGLAGIAAVAIAPAGLLLVVGGAQGTLAGTGFSLASSAGYALVTVLHRALGGVDPARTTLNGFVVALVLLTPLAFLEGIWPNRGVAWETAAMIGYLGVVSTALAYSLFFASLGAIRATTVSVLTLAEPVSATAIAVAALDERLTWSMLAGTGVLLAAVVILTRAESPAPA